MNGPEVFSAAWADAWCSTLNGSDAYRAAAARWEGDVAIVMRDDAGAMQRAVYLDLHHGTCRAARPANADEVAGARYVMEATVPVWRELLEGRTPPLMALMTNRLRLTRGSMAALLPFAAAARELVAAAVALDTSFEGV